MPCLDNPACERLGDRAESASIVELMSMCSMHAKSALVSNTAVLDSRGCVLGQRLGRSLGDRLGVDFLVIELFRHYSIEYEYIPVQV